MFDGATDRMVVENGGEPCQSPPTWARERDGSLTLARAQKRDRRESGVERPDWRVVDRALRGIRARRAALDVEEARWLREAEALQIWRPLGMVSILDYLERVLGYAPRTAQDRLRVARSLGDLPRLGE